MIAKVGVTHRVIFPTGVFNVDVHGIGRSPECLRSYVAVVFIAKTACGEVPVFNQRVLVSFCSSQAHCEIIAQRHVEETFELAQRVVSYGRCHTVIYGFCVRLLSNDIHQATECIPPIESALRTSHNFYSLEVNPTSPTCATGQAIGVQRNCLAIQTCHAAAAHPEARKWTLPSHFQTGGNLG